MLPELFVEYTFISCELAPRIFPYKLCLLGEDGVLAISDVLLEGGLIFKTYTDNGGGGLKSKDFLGDVIYG